MASLGNLLLILATLGTAVSLGALLLGHFMGEKEGEGATNVGYLATFGVVGFLTLAVLVLMLAFFRNDYSILYVALEHPTAVGPISWLYKISAVWAGREGSFLFWAWLVSVFAAYVAWARLSITDRISNVALAITEVVQLLFLILILTPTNTPFASASITADGFILNSAGQVMGTLATSAMNPLLQTWAMIIHPPTLFIGYAGLTIPFAFALSALILNEPGDEWVRISDRITVFSWLLLGIGIGLGAVWAYYELAFGGYWAWDPVENASLLPWLTGVGLVHSMTVYRRRDAFKGWTTLLAAVTFALVILGTWITRSGVLSEGASVHTFQADAPSFWVFLILIVGSLVSVIGMLLYRRASFKGRELSESLLAKEVSYEVNNIVMLMAALLITYMTLSSVMPKPLPAAGLTIGKETYNALAHPIGILYVLLIAICPILSWRKTEPATFWSRAKWPLAGTAALGAGFLAVYFTQLWPNYVAMGGAGSPFTSFTNGWESMFGLVVAAFGISLPIYLFIDGARKRAKAKSESIGTALLNIFTKARTQSGGYLTHLGIGVILAGLIGSTLFVRSVSPNILNKPGEKFSIGEYGFTLQRVKEQTRANGDKAQVATFTMTKGGGAPRTVQAAIMLPKQMQSQTSDFNSGRREVAIISEPLQDVFITLQSLQGDTLGMDVKLNPLIGFVWAGFVLTILGSGLAAWPKKRAAA